MACAGAVPELLIMRDCRRQLSRSVCTTLGSTTIRQLFTDDYKDFPYWWEDAPRPRSGIADLPEHVDVAIIGSGYTGLNAAIQTARAGRSTLVMDAHDAGWGCRAVAGNTE